MISRRTVLRSGASGLLAAPGLLRQVNAQGLRRVKFTLPWLPEGSYAYAYVAKAQGYWRTRGLDVDIARGFGGLQAGQAIAQGQFDCGITNAQAIVLLASKGSALQGLGMLDYDPTMAVAVLQSSSIRQPKDLEGRRVAQTMSSSDAPFFAPFCSVAGVDIGKVQIVGMDARVRNEALVQGRIDAITGFASSILATLGAQKVPLRFMLYRDHGLGLYGNMVLAVPPQTAAQQPELCQSLLDGLMEGVKYTELNPDPARDLFLAALPEMKLSANGAEFARLGMGVQRFSFLSTDDSREHAVGWMDPAALANMAGLVMRYQGESGGTAVDMNGCFTNRFAGAVTLTAEEWRSAQANTAWVNALLRG